MASSNKEKLPLVGPFETFAVQSSSLLRHKRSRLLWTECSNCYDSNKAELMLDKPDRMNYATWTISIKLDQGNDHLSIQNKSFHQSVKRLGMNSTSEKHCPVDEDSHHKFESTSLTDELRFIFSSNSILCIILLTAVLLSIINISLLLRRKMRRGKQKLSSSSPSVVTIATQAMIVVEHEIEPHSPKPMANSIVVENSDIITPLRIIRRQVQPSSLGSNYDDRNVYSCHSISTNSNSKRYSTPGHYQQGRSFSGSPSEVHDDSYLPVASVSVNSRSSLQDRSRSNIYDANVSPYQCSGSRNHSLDEENFNNSCTQANLQLLPIRSFTYPSLLSAEFASPVDKCKGANSSSHSSPSNDDDIGELSDIYDCLEVVDNDSDDANAIDGNNRIDSSDHLDLSHLYGDSDDNETKGEAELGRDCGYAADEHGFAFVDDNPALSRPLHSPAFRNSRNNSNNCSMISNDVSRYATPRSLQGPQSTSADHKYRVRRNSEWDDSSNDVVLDDCDKTSNEDDGCSSGRHSENGDNMMIDEPNKEHLPDSECHGIVAEIEQCVTRLKANENEPSICVKLNLSAAFEDSEDLVLKSNRSSIANFLDCSRMLLIDNEEAARKSQSRVNTPRAPNIRKNIKPNEVVLSAIPLRPQNCGGFIGVERNKDDSYTNNGGECDKTSSMSEKEIHTQPVNVNILRKEDKSSPHEQLNLMLCATEVDQKGTELDILIPLNTDTVDLAAPVNQFYVDISGNIVGSCKSVEYMTIEKYFIEVNDDYVVDVLPREDFQSETIYFDPLTIS
eukprot:CAMPEP_0170081330 /NCGR_PEP_ID=MMETSP0019_2-20121128/17222_1 /TAXON_ID=98059 /ORGANISM="Dinobryon sp., Strain UTEXLB2267" /LENGTH=786 /DNA_ID=CAMNT_0010295701 /DNA_START=189 /DNA_END=2549 /DNA_ORIENTATION=+